MEMHRESRGRKLGTALVGDESRWPGTREFHQATKGKFALHSQSVQQVFRALYGAVMMTSTKRSNGDMTAQYPNKPKRLYPLMWTAQAVCVEKGERNRLVLPMGRGRPSLKLKVRGLPDEVGAVRIVWNNGIELRVQTEAEVREAPTGREGVRACVDLGEIHLASVATNEGDALVVSGRAIRSQKRLRNKALGEIAKLQSRCVRGSRRWKKLQRAKRKLLGHTERRIRDLRHRVASRSELASGVDKATHAVVAFCAEHDVRTVFVGNPDGVRRNPKGKRFNQKIAQWEYGKDKQYLQEKCKKAGLECFTGSERYTSSLSPPLRFEDASRCPKCGCRHRPKGRRWICPECGFSGHRDIVGAVNMHALTFGERVEFPETGRTTYLRPARESRRMAKRHACVTTGGKQ